MAEVSVKIRHHRLFFSSFTPRGTMGMTGTYLDRLGDDHFLGEVTIRTDEPPHCELNTHKPSTTPHESQSYSLSEHCWPSVNTYALDDIKEREEPDEEEDAPDVRR